MATPAIENLANYFNDSDITLIGSIVAIEALKNHPKVTKTYVLEKNYFNLYNTIKSFGEFDVFFSFRSSFRSKFMKFCISSKRKYQFDKNKFIKGHQVEKYNDFINNVINITSIPGELILHSQKKTKDSKNKLLGINPGASYGSAKRWYPKKFADVAINLSSHYDIVIFGGTGENEIASDIEKYLIEKGIDIERLTASGMGETEPFVVEHKDGKLKVGDVLSKVYIDGLRRRNREAAHQYNRRTTFKVISQEYVPKPKEEVKEEEVEGPTIELKDEEKKENVQDIPTDNK